MTPATPRPAPTGHTRVAAVIGSPVRHSLSPALHNAAFAAAGLDWVYLAFEVAPGAVPAALGGVRALGIAGLSVTMPHKDAVAAGCDEVSVAARALGAVNCVVNDGGRLVGHNTDGAGFVASLREEGCDPAGMRCVVLGAGGAARAVVEALGAAGAAEVCVVNRTAAKAEVAAALAGGAGRVGGADAVAGADLIVNATSVGMGADAGSLPCDAGLLRAGQWVADIVYEPADTALLLAARAVGAHPIGGIGMLIHQAAVAFTLWTGVDAPVHAMRTAGLAALDARQRT